MKRTGALAMLVGTIVWAFPARAAAGHPVAMPRVFSAWGRRAALAPIRMEVGIEVGGRRHPITLDPAGFEAATKVLAWLFPGAEPDGTPRYARSGTWQVLEKLSEPAFEDEFVRIADLSTRKTFKLTIIGDDDPDAMVTAAVHTRDGVREIRFGESRIQRDGELETFLPVLLHEVGHVADDTSCRLDYGPDGNHYSYEILNPGAAFKEGWGDYLGAKLPGPIQRFVQDPRPLAIEGSVARQGRAGVYRTLDAEDLRVNDFMSNEAWVAKILTGLEALPPGRAGVERVFVRTNHGSCRHLAGFLGTWVATYPSTREAVRALLLEATGESGSAADYDRILDGDLVGRLDPEDLPRPRDEDGGGPEGGGWLATVLDWIKKPFEPGKPASVAEPSGLLGTGD